MLENFIFTLEIISEGKEIQGFKRMVMDCKNHRNKIFCVSRQTLEDVIERIKEIKFDKIIDEFIVCTSAFELPFILRKMDSNLEKTIFISSDIELLHTAGNSSMCLLGITDNDNEGCMIEGVEMVFEGFDDTDYNYLNKLYQRKNKIPWTIFETKRCLVREITISDVEDLYNIYADKEITKYIEPLYEQKEREVDYIKAYIENMYKFYGFGMWAVFEKYSGKMIGRAGLGVREMNGVSELEMGYVIGVPFQKKGYAYEVCCEIIEYVKNNLEYNRLNCLINKENIPSIRLVEKLGLVLIGEIKDDKEEYQRYCIYYN